MRPLANFGDLPVMFGGGFRILIKFGDYAYFRLLTAYPNNQFPLTSTDSRFIIMDKTALSCGTALAESS